MLIAREVPDSLSTDFIRLFIPTFSLLARLNMSLELFHYLGKTREEPRQLHSLQQGKPCCHFLLSLSVYWTERAEAEELKLVINHNNFFGLGFNQNLIKLLLLTKIEAK